MLLSGLLRHRPVPHDIAPSLAPMQQMCASYRLTHVDSDSERVPVIHMLLLVAACRISVAVMGAVMIVLAFLTWAARSWIVGIFTDEPSVTAMTKSVLPAVAASLVGA